MAVLQQIKREHPDIEVIILTGDISAQPAVEGINLGAFAYLMKPLTIDEIQAKVEDAFARKRHREDSAMKENKVIRVLIVDDEERFRATATTILKKRGFEVKAVGSGSEALAEIRRDNVDVVVLDVKMPTMDGNEALHRMKIIRPELEVVILTGHGTMRSAFMAFRDEVFEYLTKPCDYDILADTIRSAATKKKDPIRGAEWHSLQSKTEPDM